MATACCCFQIDLQTFLTLTDQDLKELGITTFGARRKMLLAISGRNAAEPPVRDGRRRLHPFLLAQRTFSEPSSAAAPPKPES